MSGIWLVLLGIPAIAAVLTFLVFYPEVAFALFLYSYVLEGGDVLPGYFDLTGITLVIALLGFLLSVSRRESRLRLEVTSPDIWLWALSVVVFVACLWSPTPAAAVSKALRFGVLAVLPFFVARIFLRDEKQLYRFLATLVAMAAVTAILLLRSPLATPTTSSRFQLLQANQIPVGLLLSVGFVIVVVASTEDLWKGIIGRILSFAIALLCLAGIILLGVRGPLVAALIGLIAFVVLRFWVSERGVLQFDRPAVATVFLAVALVATSNVFLQRLPTFEQYYTIAALAEGVSTLERLLAYEAALNLFAQAPLLGVGTAGFSELTVWPYPHNIFLEVAAETGTAGLVLFVVFIVSVGAYGLKALKEISGRRSAARGITLTILVVTVVLLAERQISFGLSANKDLFAFLGLVPNLKHIIR